jgi:hypothetical protein
MRSGGLRILSFQLSLELNRRQLTRFAIRLALSGHVGMPRENESDFLN